MSKEFYSLLILKCDHDRWGGCHGDLTIKIEEGETQASAERMARDVGWEISSEGKVSCPKHSKQNHGLSIVR